MGLEPGGIGIRERQSPEELQMDGCCLMLDSSGGLGMGHFPELSSLVAAPPPDLESLQVTLELLRDLTPLAQQAEKVQHVKRAPERLPWAKPSHPSKHLPLTRTATKLQAQMIVCWPSVCVCLRSILSTI